MRVARHWHRFPSEVVNAPSLEAFQARLDGALSDLIQVQMSLLAAGELGWMASAGPFQPKALSDSQGAGAPAELTPRLARPAGTRPQSCPAARVCRQPKRKQAFGRKAEALH